MRGAEYRVHDEALVGGRGIGRSNLWAASHAGIGVMEENKGPHAWGERPRGRTEDALAQAEILRGVAEPRALIEL